MEKPDRQKPSSDISDIEEQAAALRRLASELSLAEVRERRRIAEDLHDHLAQYLALIRMKLSSFQGNTMFCGYEQDLVEIQELLDKAIRYTRHLTMAISPPILYQLGLVPALEWLAEEYSRSHKLNIHVNVGQRMIDIDEDLRGIIYRSIRELLLNVVKHAAAGTVDVTISTDGGYLDISIRDDGKGFDPEAVSSNSDAGFGLFSISERLKYLGGELQVRSQPGTGSTVLFRCPVRRVSAP